MVRSVLIGKRLKPVTAEAEVEVKKASIKDSLLVPVPGSINKTVPKAINTIKPNTSCKEMGNWRERMDLASLLKRIMRCWRFAALGFGAWIRGDWGSIIPDC
jgi:hypothetical protein